MKSPSILITGASGFTGMHACTHFASKGYEVTGTVRTLGIHARVPDVNYMACDLTDAIQVKEVVEQVKPMWVLHLGGKNSVPESLHHPLLYMQSNVMGTLHLLEALRIQPECRILVAGSRLKFDLTVPLSPTHPYALSKSMQEIAALSWGDLFGQDVLIAEPGNLMGPGPSTGICSLFAKYIVQVEQGKNPPVFRLSSPDERRDFLDVRDAVLAYERLLAQGETGSITPVCSGIEHTLGEVAHEMITLSNQSIPFDQGTSKNVSTALPIQPHHLRSLGWEPAYAWASSLEAILEYFREEGRASS
ncbi:GDP-4-dehydro-6-deoxy-D-mannose reductase [Paenibacillus shirakamiensis]|uniref:GDP-4-dehydro-6-deoxy-D-mannose reductase n=1 Tax=Paenibacillus shirakamiensis TaxID=1265935 RepID=A0ABS4JKA5_9BACL|nr:NAD-dependent epimerase/dehydratase family protein [Paenibacillus shirakamiensis]MBP2002140.1 GDP-4-dehydro-6-deoxy-D-mannose reductase [Paenibacillus shirakamiensis]